MIIIENKQKSHHKSTAEAENGWECDTCKKIFNEKKSKLLECEYCEVRRCTNCWKVTDAVYNGLRDRQDFPWFCKHCLPKALKFIREEREIEARCNEFLGKFKQEVDEKFHNMQSEIDQIKSKLENKEQPSINTSIQQSEVVNEVCNNVSDKMARKKNIAIFNITCLRK